MQQQPQLQYRVRRQQLQRLRLDTPRALRRCSSSRSYQLRAPTAASFKFASVGLVLGLLLVPGCLFLESPSMQNTGSVDMGGVQDAGGGSDATVSVDLMDGCQTPCDLGTYACDGSGRLLQCVQLRWWLRVLGLLADSS